MLEIGRYGQTGTKLYYKIDELLITTLRSKCVQEWRHKSKINYLALNYCDR